MRFTVPLCRVVVDDGVYVQCFLGRLGSVFPQFGLLVSRSVGAVWTGGLCKEGIGPPNLYIPGL